MAKTLRQLLLGVSLCLGVGTIAGAPAWAGSLTNPFVSGGSYYTYDANTTHTFLVPNGDAAQLTRILAGDSTNPTGNIELFADSEADSYRNLAAFQNAPVTSLSGTLMGQSLTLSSLTGRDWFGESMNTAYGAATFATQWFNSVLSANGFGNTVGSSIAHLAFNKFLGGGGFQRFSDPNISYVYQDSNNVIRIGMAGHWDGTDLLLGSMTTLERAAFFALRSPDMRGLPIQISELVRYHYNGESGILYSFNGIRSSLHELGDGRSHNATYEVTLAGVVPDAPSQSVPEPSLMLGMLGVGGVVISRKRAKTA